MKVISTSLVTSTDTNYRHVIDTAGHALIADEPERAGGKGAGPGPYDYVLAGLGACTAITLRMYAQRKEWDIAARTPVTKTLMAGSPISTTYGENRSADQ